MTRLADPQLEAQRLKQEYNLTTLVETGCYEGDSLNFAKSIGFEHLYSCDINETYVHRCRNAFPNAKIEHQESISWMKDTLPTLEGATLFWLDAHYPIYYGLGNEDDLTKFPLVEELKLVKQLKKGFEKDIIICDDLRVLAPDNNPYYAGFLDQKFMVTHSIADLVAVLADTHTHWTVAGETGNLIFIPK